MIGRSKQTQLEKAKCILFSFLLTSFETFQFRTNGNLSFLNSCRSMCTMDELVQAEGNISYKNVGVLCILSFMFCRKN